MPVMVVASGDFVNQLVGLRRWIFTRRGSSAAFGLSYGTKEQKMPCWIVWCAWCTSKLAPVYKPESLFAWLALLPDGQGPHDVAAETSTSAAVRSEENVWLIHNSVRMLQPLYRANPPLSTS